MGVCHEVSHRRRGSSCAAPFDCEPEASQGILRRAIDAFSEPYAAAARRVLDHGDAITGAQDALIERCIGNLSSHPERASLSVDVIFVARNFERSPDDAINIAEDVILDAKARNVKHASKPRGERSGARSASAPRRSETARTEPRDPATECVSRVSGQDCAIRRRPATVLNAARPAPTSSAVPGSGITASQACWLPSGA